MMDICDDNQHEINDESDVTNLKEYMKVLFNSYLFSRNSFLYSRHTNCFLYFYY